MMLTELQAELGWQGLADRININCFSNNPSLKSSLTFLRKTPWARQKVEQLYVKTKGLSVKNTPTANIDTHSDSSENKPVMENPWQHWALPNKRGSTQ
ncbi:VF530 family protein [Paraneptunicella aestuarii]|nr:VF530 family protein [Paraneptunicella aestuarii]